MSRPAVSLAGTAGQHVLSCGYFDRVECRSCTWLGQGYDDQLAAKDAATRALVAGPATAWLPPVASRPEGFRNKAKMVVAGTMDEPTLGILHPRGGGVDLRDCGLHTPGLAAALPVLADFVTLAGLTPYDVGSDLPVPQRGELKHVLVTESPDGELMVRWVLRSTGPLARVRKHLPWLAERLPLRVMTVNVQPEHRAVLEGEREIVLTDDDSLPMRLSTGVTLHLRPRSFFQTNTEVATALYATAREWLDELAPRSVWDLYCGVGGFALHAAGPGRDVLGIEISADAVASAERSRDEASLERVRFEAGDATEVAAREREPVPDVVVVNPPRRGLGAGLAGWLESSRAPYVVYSSCNPQTLAADLAVMGSYEVVKGRVLDMFPQTGHLEVLVLLRSRR